MKQLLELARLRFELQRSYTEIAGSLGVARSTVQEAVKRFGSAGWSDGTSSITPSERGSAGKSLDVGADTGNAIERQDASGCIRPPARGWSLRSDYTC